MISKLVIFSGLEAFESHDIVRRTPDMIEDLSRESLTPTNELYSKNNEDGMNAEDFVEIKGPEIDLDKISDGIGGDLDDVTGENIDVQDIEEKVTEVEADMDGDSVNERGAEKDGSSWAEDVIEANDDVVEGMIEEGIRQVAQDGLIDLEEDTVQYPSHLTPDRYGTYSFF